MKKLFHGGTIFNGGTIFILCVLGVIGALVGGGMALSAAMEPDYSVCEFTPGQMVKSKVSGEIGQVIAMRAVSDGDWCYADVRFTGLQSTTDSRVLSNDRPIMDTPLMVVQYMRPYELEHLE